jgi:hypothetical protein
MREVHVRSQQQLQTFIQGQRAPGRAVYRGQRDARWSLVPNLFRGLETLDPPLAAKTDAVWLAQLERELLRRFSIESGKLPGPRNLSPLSTLCLAQHHGVPTRLLDWSTNWRVALFFALASAAETPAALWCLDTEALEFEDDLGRLSEEVFHRVEVLESLEETHGAFSFLHRITQVSGATGGTKGFLSLLRPPMIDNRIDRQRGLFSVFLSFDDHDIEPDHGPLIRRMEQTSGQDALTKVVVHPEAFAGLRAGPLSDTNWLTVYPDLEGLGMKLVDDRSRLFERERGRR